MGTLEASSIALEVSRVLDARGGEVRAAFLIGSVAREAANLATSDVDLLLVISRGAEASKLHAIGTELGASLIPFDAIAVDQAELEKDVVPASVHFLVKPTFGLIAHLEPRWEVALAREDAAECRIILFGADKSYRPAPTPWRTLRRSIGWVAPQIRRRFKNPALSLTRVLYSVHTHRLCSKVEAGNWGLHNLDKKYRTMIERDLNAYCKGSIERLPEHLLGELETDVLISL